jgi:hypothetical protein
MTSPAYFSGSACDDDHEFQRERTLVDCIIFKREYDTAFDIREEKGDSPRRQVSHRFLLMRIQ